jgi:endonuclease-3
MPVGAKVAKSGTSTPRDFHKIWQIVNSLRSIRDAPVDIWGCDKVVDHSAPRDVFEFQILVAAMLSSQTKDRCVKQGMDSLLRSDLSVAGILSMSVEEIDEKIKMVGFHTTKARNIKAVAKIIKDEYDGHVPAEFSDLTRLPGVGPKMANLVMSCAFGKTSGICVDTHVHRICSILGWGCSRCKECKSPEHTRASLETWLPPNMWKEFTYMLVGLGQMQQGSRKILLDRSLRTQDPLETLKFLRRIKFNFSNLQAAELALELGCHTSVVDYLRRLS